MKKKDMLSSFLNLENFDEYLLRLDEFTGLALRKEAFKKQMLLMEGDSNYTHREKDQLVQKRKAEIICKLNNEIETLCREIAEKGVYINPSEKEAPYINIVYSYPGAQNEDINHSIAKKKALSIDTQDDVCFAVFSKEDIPEIDMILFPVKNFFSGYDFSKLENDSATSFLLKHNRVLQLEYLMWKVNYLKPEYRSLRSLKEGPLKKILQGHHKKIRNRRNKIYEELIKDGDTHARWISEQKAYAIVKAHYSDAKFQYQPAWLFGQRLDIFIPSLNTGIKYQGKQHTKPVEFFGGEEGLINNIKRDRRKKYHCDLNGVKLLYWDYTDPLTDEFFENHLNPLIKE